MDREKSCGIYVFLTIFSILCLVYRCFHSNKKEMEVLWTAL